MPAAGEEVARRSPGRASSFSACSRKSGRPRSSTAGSRAARSVRPAAGAADSKSGGQRELVAEAVRVYKESLRPAIARSVPFWPLGLPRWDDTWVALGLRAAGGSHLAVWRRPQDGDGGSAAVSLPVRHLRGVRLTPRVLYPHHAGVEAGWDADLGTLTVILRDAPSACVVRLEP